MDLDFLHLNYRRRIAALIWTRRAVVVGAFVSVFFALRHGRLALVPLILAASIFGLALAISRSARWLWRNPSASEMGKNCSATDLTACCSSRDIALHTL